MPIDAAMSATISKVVASGRATKLETYWIFSKENCRPGPKPKVEFKQPQNGTISVSWGTLGVIPKGLCKNVSVKGYFISYTPNRGYRGKDTGKVYFSFLKYGTSVNVVDTLTINLTVK